MKIILACLLLSTVGLTLATPFDPFVDNDGYVMKKEGEKVRALLQTFADKEDKDTEDNDDNDNDIASLQSELENAVDIESDEDTDDYKLEDTVDTEDYDDGDRDIAALQGVFDMLAQVDKQKAKEKSSETASAQLLGFLGNALWNIGKGFLRRRFCSEKETMIQELVDKQEMSDEDNKEKDSIALAKLKSLFSALRKAEANTMQYDYLDDDNATVERRRRRGRRRRGKGRGRGRRRWGGRRWGRRRWGRRRWWTRGGSRRRGYGSRIGSSVGGLARKFLC